MANTKHKKDEVPEEKPLEAEIVEETPEASPVNEFETALKAEKEKYLLSLKQLASSVHQVAPP